MFKDIPITEAREQITSLPERLAGDPQAVPITRRGRPVLAIMPWEFYESLMETLEIMSDQELMASFRRGVRELKQGKGVAWEKVKRELKL